MSSPDKEALSSRQTAPIRRVRRRKRSGCPEPKTKRRVRKRSPKTDANGEGIAHSERNEIGRATLSERKERPRAVAKPGRDYEPLIYAKNGMRIEDLDHKTGYSKPPEKGKFKKGSSGNPKGRPKGKKNTDTLLKEGLEQKVVIRAGGKQKKISAREGIAQRMIQKALEGDPRFVKLVLELDKDFELQTLPDERVRGAEQNQGAIYDQILEEFERQILERTPGALDEPEDGPHEEEDNDDS